METGATLTGMKCQKPTKYENQKEKKMALIATWNQTFFNGEEIHLEENESIIVVFDDWAVWDAKKWQHMEEHRSMPNVVVETNNVGNFVTEWDMRITEEKI